MSKYQLSVEVVPQYLHDQSNPEEDLYVFAYTITITNTGEVPAQLISRTWNVNDANGHTEKVKGLGVVGQQPLLKPGQAPRAPCTAAFSAWPKTARSSTPTSPCLFLMRSAAIPAPAKGAPCTDDLSF
jgi:uncharacterized protein affecting Mg2+/Co2+ transport